ncbi:MAG: CopG family transcriptional regulator [Deltaproteobacteria bacterium]|nr:CopG family transcriptional regulator [Deltaproteobacteria bacterium]
MPAVSFYLPQETLNTVRTKAKAENIPVSKIIREAVENHLKTKESIDARQRVLKCLAKKKPLGGMEGWKQLHQERDAADADRG